ncbi:MAG: phosphate/phosphite/phosphonate ABC transporter substrate-binding protein [Zoogloeaceae bacterium]|nr:phosphate/phosphite/phosphonate ABC transporter substrate-binding protein [Zoogloeaceae bacterium]
MDRRSFLTCLPGMFFLSLPIRGGAARQITGQAASGLRLGIVPFNSALALFRIHQPLRQHLEATLRVPVTLHSSVDHARFLHDTLAFAFDLVVISPHLAVLALEAGFVPLCRYQKEMRIGLIVRRENQSSGIAGLRGRRIGVPDRLSIFAVGGGRWLDESGLAPYVLSLWPSHGAALAAVATGNLDAALSGEEILRQIPADLRNTLTFLPFAERIPHLMTLCRVALGEAQLARIRAALLAFPATPAGAKFFRDTGYQGYLPVSERDLRIMRPHVERTRKLLASPESESPE